MTQRRFFFAALCAFCCGTQLFAQQITRFAVVDFNRILSSLNIRSNAYADLEKKSAQIQAEIDRRREEITEAQARLELLQKPPQPAEYDGVEPEAMAQDAPPARPPVRSPQQQKAHEAEIARQRNDIIKKTEALKDYYQKKTAELDAEKSRITANSATNETMNQINAQIALTAESEGYTMVLDKTTKGIIWYSRSVDITDKVIQGLSAKIKR
ncbi:MAG: OmpH family outer membrane protein [Spirochaetaceae bacterium]|jgi:Skp family chaperone for outer membrane proteins|nr:OmpH family outer membrane protein [Spirochaetaceae bacterium]